MFDSNTSYRVRTFFHFPTAILLAIVLILTARPAFAAANAQEAVPADITQSNETLLVQFAEGTSEESRDATIDSLGGEMVTWMPQINVAAVHVTGQSGVVVASAMASVITFAENDVVVEGVSTYSDPDLNDATMNYGLSQVRAIDAWSITPGSQDIVIAVVDSGIKLDHPEFAGRLVPGYDFVNSDDRPDDDVGHGTHVAGIIAAALNNGQGIAGVCPNCRLMPVKVLNALNQGSWSQLVQGILFAADHGAQVINLSLGAAAPSETLAAAIQYAQDRGAVVVAAAGNSATDSPFYPAALDGVIAVGATTNAGDLWSRSNFGSYIDLVAPGALVYSTYSDLNNMYHGYTYMSGTSMAAPFVSGVAGLLLSANHALTAQQVAEIMDASASDLGSAGWDSKFGHGRVDAVAALYSPAVGLVENLGGIATPKLSQKLFLPAVGQD